MYKIWCKNTISKLGFELFCLFEKAFEGKNTFFLYQVKRISNIKYWLFIVTSKTFWQIIILNIRACPVKFNSLSFHQKNLYFGEFFTDRGIWHTFRIKKWSCGSLKLFCLDIVIYYKKNVKSLNQRQVNEILQIYRFFLCWNGTAMIGQWPNHSFAWHENHFDFFNFLNHKSYNLVTFLSKFKI